MQTQKFILVYGIEYEGKAHIDGEMRLPNLEDVECALEECPDGACQARINRHIWARCITRLGDIPAGKLTAEMLATAADSEFTVLQGAENTLRKKLKPLNSAAK
jgi:hypothetical protein